MSDNRETSKMEKRVKSKRSQNTNAEKQATRKRKMPRPIHWGKRHSTLKETKKGEFREPKSETKIPLSSIPRTWQQAANFSRTDYAPPNSKGSYRARLYLRKAQRIGQTFRNVFNIINRRKQVRQTIETQQSIQTKCSTITQLRKLSKSRIDKAATTISIHPYKIAKTKLDIKL